LKKVQNESLDFIIGNHFIEHTRDPIGTISNWLSKLKPGGVIFMAVPDKRYTFDIERELTSLQHLISDHHSNPGERLVPDRQHFAEWATFVDKLSPKEIEPRVNFLSRACMQNQKRERWKPE
jgi:predicted SAM-dependent methyltransferase